MKADLYFKNIRIYDGSGRPSFRGSLVLHGGKIAQILRDQSFFDCDAEEVIDGKGLDLAPGFIDSHSHADEVITENADRLQALQMGVTTELAGQCGHTRSPYPENVEENLFRMASGAYKDTHYESFGAMMESYQNLPLGTNQAWFTGHGALRTYVMGFQNRKAEENEIAKMRELLDREMAAGAFGYSSGLAYVPGIYSDSHELSGIAEALKPYGGIYTSHSRSESSGLFHAVQECIDVAKLAHVPVNISHFKTCYPDFWDRQEEAIRMIDEANREGLCVTMDAYPYIAVSTTTLSAMPAKFLDRGAEAFAEMLKNPEIKEAVRKEIYEIDSPTWDNALKHAGADRFLIVGADTTPEIEGLSYTELAARLGMDDPFDAVCWALIQNQGKITDVRFIMKEENVEQVLAHPLCSVGSDGIFKKGKDRTCHPRAFGTFPRYLGHYIREREILSREEGIRRITGMPAERYGLKGKGFIREGYDGDLVLFDYDSIQDGGTFRDPFLPNQGIERVLLAGKTALLQNESTGVFAGRFLKH